ncbi:MAG TPA: HAD family hydrolase [Thermoplasmata archaeon]|nr:HAD family hydrolase [Thermoplasmata archaeon]
MIKIVSFDLDGTLTKPCFADRYWLEGVPGVYAEEKGIPLEKAKTLLLKEYDCIGKERIEWYDPEYWFKKFGIKYSWRRLIYDYKNMITPYPDVLPTLKALEKKHTLVIISNAKQEFIEIQLKETVFNRFFTQVFSSVSDFGMVKKNREVYKRVCSLLSIKEEEMLHVGDDPLFDYEIPRSIGVKAVYLDRGKNSKGENIIYSLKSLPSLLSRYEESGHL